MNVAVFHVGSSLPPLLRRAEREINEQYDLKLRITCHNSLLPFTTAQWSAAHEDLARADVVFVIHVTESENSARIAAALDGFRDRHRAVIGINCMTDLMRRTRIGGLEFARWGGDGSKPKPAAQRLLRKLGSWMALYARRRQGGSRARQPEQYLKLLRQVPAILRFVPPAGPLKDIRHYLTLYCYFLQPTPANVRAMMLYAVQHLGPDRKKGIRVDPPESMPAMGVYHPDAPSLFASFDEYREWYERTRNAPDAPRRLDAREAVGLLLLRPQVVSGARRHYDTLIRCIEREGIPVVPILSTFMDNRGACGKFLQEPSGASRVGQIVSLTGFSFVGGPAMNDSEAAAAYLRELNRPYRSLVSLEMQKVEDWSGSMIGLNPVQTAMQVALPELDGATEPHIFGGVSRTSDEPEPLTDRCRRVARRLARWNRLRTLPRDEIRLAYILYCFPPNKGNLGTAADLDVFPSLWHIFRRLAEEGYRVDGPESPGRLREMILGTDGSSEGFVANIADRLSATDYFRLCPYVEEIEAEWGPAPGSINSHGPDILIHGVALGNVLVAVQPTFGYEGDPMRMLMAHGGTPHHGFMGLYVYLEKIFQADALVHVGTHGALEFMPGKQAGLSSRCWPDRLIGELPNLYIYSVNNPSEGSIAKRRSYAELISYLTPPVENAGLYKELASFKELLTAYRQCNGDAQKDRLFAAIEEQAQRLNLSVS